MTFLKQFFYRATPLVVFFLSFSVIITVLSFLLVKPDTSEYPVSGLSMDSVEVAVRQAEVEEAAFTNLDFLQFLEECSYHVVVVQDNPYANGQGG